MTARQVALALQVPERTTQRWLAHWFAAGVRGIERVPLRGSVVTYVVAPFVVARWKRGRLPVPRASSLRAA